MTDFTPEYLATVQDDHGNFGYAHAHSREEAEKNAFRRVTKNGAKLIALAKYPDTYQYQINWFPFCIYFYKNVDDMLGETNNTMDNVEILVGKRTDKSE